MELSKQRASMVFAGRGNAARSQGEWSQHSFTSGGYSVLELLTQNSARQPICKRFHIARHYYRNQQSDKTIFEISEAFLSQEHFIPKSPWLAITFAKKSPVAHPSHFANLPQIWVVPTLTRLWRQG